MRIKVITLIDSSGDQRITIPFQDSTLDSGNI
jgi:hypothetical protein